MVAAETRRSADEMFAGVYERLKSLASSHLSDDQGSTLNTTALVHELYLRIGNDRTFGFERTGQFFNYAARAIRHLLIDRARTRLSQRAGGQWQRIEFGTVEAVSASAEQLIKLDEALDSLAKIDARAAAVVELRYFAGLTAEQAADALTISKRTGDRDWTFAIAFLRTEFET
jgi:RNA polymerase sigma factor (TIGR02999 family)